MNSGQKKIGCALMAIISIVIALSVLFPLLQAFPEFRGIRVKAREAEVKQNLHAFQLAVERYAVDSGGPYPGWISGGGYAEGTSGKVDERYVADPLISEDYMPVAPRNPFANYGESRTDTTYGLREMQELLLDPLRPIDGADLHAPAFRFGTDHSLMGNVLADPRFASMLVGRDVNGNPQYRQTGADIIYRCWDIAELDKPQHWLQGQFFYKSYGPVIAVGDLPEGTPDYSRFNYMADQYVMGAYGGVNTKGQDVLGAEQSLQAPEDDRIHLDLMNHTGLTVPGYSLRQASPISFTADPEGVAYGRPGNPNGIADGVVIMLSAGSDRRFDVVEREGQSPDQNPCDGEGQPQE